MKTKLGVYELQGFCSPVGSAQAESHSGPVDTRGHSVKVCNHTKFVA